MERARSQKANQNGNLERKTKLRTEWSCKQNGTIRAGKIFSRRVSGLKDKRHVSKVRKLKDVKDFEGLTNLLSSLQYQLVRRGLILAA